MPVQPFKFYLNHEVTFKIISTRWGLFTIIGGVIYLLHLCWAIAGVNSYCDYTRLNKCGDAQTGEEASSVYDTAIALSAVFHMIEWVRWTTFLTSALVTVNLIPAFLVLSVNAPFGLLATLVAVFTRYSSDGNACAEEDMQATRGLYLSLQIVALLVYAVTSFAHALFFKIQGLDWCHEMYLMEEEEEED